MPIIPDNKPIEPSKPNEDGNSSNERPNGD